MEAQLKSNAPDGSALWAAINAFQVTRGEIKTRIHRPIRNLSVGSLADAGLETMPTDVDIIFNIPFLGVGGLGTEDSDLGVEANVFYQRDAVKGLWNRMVDLQAGAPASLVVKGPPGTGKSTAIWRKVLSMAASEERGKCNILWLKLNRKFASEKVVYFQGKNFCTDFDLILEDVPAFLSTEGVPLDLVVVDGLGNGGSSDTLFNEVRYWVNYESTHAIFSSSVKVEELRPHENRNVTYHTFHSWQLEEFEGAMIQNNSPTLLCEQCSELFYEDHLHGEPIPGGGYSCDDPVTLDADELAAMEASLEAESEEAGADDDAIMEDETEKEERPAKRAKTITPREILDIVKNRYEYSGGSARWMFNYTRITIDSKLDEYCQSSSNREAILKGDIGPTSSSSTNYFFGSSEKSNGKPEYFLVSKRAIEILGEQCKGSSYRVLYDFASRLENPSFVGWVVESDFFFQVDQARKTGTELSIKFISDTCDSLRPVGIEEWQHAKNAKLRLTEEASQKVKVKKRAVQNIKNIARDFVPKKVGESIAGKPNAWNQGGYDAFFVENAGTSEDHRPHIHLRFGQVTKGISHDLKAHFMHSVVLFFEKAGYVIDSVEIAFILTEHNSRSFQLSTVVGEHFLADYKRFGLATKWDVVDEHSIAKYELELSHARTL